MQHGTALTIKNM